MAAPSDRPVEVPRPPRPRTVELAAAILVIGSATDAVISFEGLANASTAEARLLSAASIAIGVALVALGFLVRSGRAWLVALNVAAVAAFLELRSLTPGGILAAVLDFIVLAILLRERWWFRWRPPTDEHRPSAFTSDRWGGV